jgi:transposase
MAKGRSSKLTEAEKAMIIESYALGVSPSLIARQIKKPATQITTFHSRWKFLSTLPPKEKKSRTKIDGRFGLKIKKITLENPKMGLSKLAQKIKSDVPNLQWYDYINTWYPKKDTLKRFLGESGFKRRLPYLKPPLNEVNKAKRLAFAKKWMENGQCTLENVIWTDESRVASHSNNRRIMLWTNTADPVYQVKMHSGGNSVMFWGCFSKHGTGPLVSLFGTMDGPKYVEVLKENLLPDLELAKSTIPGRWRLMQDNAPCHTSRLVKRFLEEEDIEFIDWPPYSPDLNPIENIWHWMKSMLESNYPVCESAEEIEARFFEIWQTITPEMCANYCAGYERRLLAVIAAKGGYTKY